MEIDITLVGLIGLVLTGLEILGLITAVHAIMTVRTAQGAIAWFFPLVLFPPAALPAYWIFGRNRFLGYLQPRREGKSAVHRQVAEALEQYRHEFGATLKGDAARFKVCEKLAGLPFVSGNEVELLIDGQETFDAIFAGIEAAEEYILAEFFIIHDDRLGREFQQRLIAKAHEGVRVLLIYDAVGSHSLPTEYIRGLTEAGAQVLPFRTTRGWRNRFQLNFRNHRKIVVIDGKQAYVGGLNVGDEYMGRNEKFGPWRDTHLKMRGPAVASVQLAFAEDWIWSSNGQHIDGNWEPEQAADPGQDILVLPTGPADELESCGLAFIHFIQAARERIWIASPYFVPENDVIAALKLAALRGVDVRIMLPAKADHLLVYLSSFSYIETSELGGVKFYRYEPGFLHQKVVLVDDDFAAVGTANFDNRSFRLNFEITICGADKKYAADVEGMLARDFENSRLVTAGELHRRPFWFRLAVKASRLMAPLQ